jgi:hypothetical protein
VPSRTASDEQSNAGCERVRRLADNVTSWSKNVQAQHPPDEKERDHGHDHIPNPLAGGLWLGAVFHTSRVASWMPTASIDKGKDATAEANTG